LLPNARYNILAGYLGINMQPWFLYGVHMPEERRQRIFQMHREKLPNGEYANLGWPKYVSWMEVRTVGPVGNPIPSNGMVCLPIYLPLKNEPNVGN